MSDRVTSQQSLSQQPIQPRDKSSSLLSTGKAVGPQQETLLSEKISNNLKGGLLGNMQKLSQLLTIP